VREIIEYEDLRRAHTTVMTTLNRLWKKQLLDPIVEVRAFRYTPRYTQPELKREIASEALRHLLDVSTNVSVPLSYLVEEISKYDVRLLDNLQRLVDEKLNKLHEDSLR
jgi:predicted transcriptional regulator